MSSRRAAGAAAWAAGLALGALALRWSGRGLLAAPPLTQPGQWQAWLEARGPVEAAFALLRVAALASLWYLVAATVAGVLARLLGTASLVRATDRLTIAPLRRMLAGTLSLGFAASGVVSGAAAAQPAAPPAAGAPPATVTMHRLVPGEAAAVPAPAPVPPPEDGVATGAATWTVRPGESFWSIAESVLAQRSGRPPTDAEVVPYWRRLIDANRHELAQRANPDLIFPGQVFHVPSP